MLHLRLTAGLLETWQSHIRAAKKHDPDGAGIRAVADVLRGIQSVAFRLPNIAVWDWDASRSQLFGLNAGRMCKCSYTATYNAY